MKPTSESELTSILWSAIDAFSDTGESLEDAAGTVAAFLLWKRLSDQFLFEYRAQVAKSIDQGLSRERAEADAEVNDGYGVFVPIAARWDSFSPAILRSGDELQRRLASLENANASFEGIFRNLRLPQVLQARSFSRFEDQIENIVRLLNSVRLEDSALENDQVISAAFARMIEKLAQTMAIRGGEFATPPSVCRLIVGLVHPTKLDRVYDPVCGTGGFLAEAIRYSSERSGQKAPPKCFGQESVSSIWALCKIHLLLCGADADIRLGDTLKDPLHTEAGALQKFDVVLANPPFGMKWPESARNYDVYRRFVHDPGAIADWAFIQHVLSSMSKEGRAAMIVPLGVLFRQGRDQHIRRSLIEAGAISAVIALPPQLFYGTNIPAAILVFDRSNHPAHDEHVLFVDASYQSANDSTRHPLDRDTADSVVEVFRGFEERQGLSRIATINEIAKNDFDLSVSKYVKRPSLRLQTNLGVEMSRLKEMLSRQSVAEESAFDLVDQCRRITRSHVKRVEDD